MVILKIEKWETAIKETSSLGMVTVENCHYDRIILRRAIWKRHLLEWQSWHVTEAEYLDAEAYTA